jgi:hypothetical protein
MFYNLLLFLILLWAVHNKESDEPMQMVSWLLHISVGQNITRKDIAPCGWGERYLG